MARMRQHRPMARYVTGAPACDSGKRSSLGNDCDIRSQSKIAHSPGPKNKHRLCQRSCGVELHYRSFVALSAAFMAAACASSLESREGNDPAVIALALQTAANEAVMNRMNGTGYYQHFGATAYVPSSNPLCSSSDAVRQNNERRITCSLSVRRPTAECTDAKLCVSLEFSPAVADDPELKQVALAAMSHPCGHLTAPQELQWGDYPSAIGASARQAWRVLGCGRNEIRLSDVRMQGRILKGSIEGGR